jgi:hypothetical protein
MIPGMKRSIEADLPESTTGTESGSNYHSDQTKRFCASTSTIAPTLPYVVIHRVVCSGTAKYHEDHDPSVDFFDPPRLLAGTNRKTRLQGQQQIRDIEDYLEDHHTLSFAVYITYSCTEYHEAIKGEFKRLIMPAMDDTVAAAAKPYFYVLSKDGKPAKAEAEALILSEGLQEALQFLSTVLPQFIQKWTPSSNLEHPYLQLYHQRRILMSPSTYGLSLSHQMHLNALHNYLTEHLSSDYAEAETLCGKGLVNRLHWAKIFQPGAVIVTVQDGQPLAYVCKSCPTMSHNTLHLPCCNWGFDGTFFYNEVLLDIPWPSESETTTITGLKAYPLEHAGQEMENELRARGELFWACRSRKLVNYEEPLEGMEFQIVNPFQILIVERATKFCRLIYGTWLT